MAYTTINKSSDNFRIKTYTGNSTNNTAITWDESTNMKPDFLWLKNRTASQEHWLCDVVRGAGYFSETDTLNAQQDGTSGFDSFDTNGFTVDNSARTNRNTMVGWGWKAGTAVSGNSGGSGTYKAYTGSVNATAGFSIIKYIGNGASGHTIPHHLGAIPQMMIIKNLTTGSTNWMIYHKAMGNTKAIYFTPAAQDIDTGWWNNTSPTSSVFTLGNHANHNANNNSMIAYCFAEKQGYSKFGSYTGNGNADGTFIFTGMKPAFVIIKRISSGGDDWVMYDNKRNTFNVLDKRLNPNTNGAEQDTDILDFLSNGFKLKGTPDYVNGNGSTYIYMSFGQSLVGSNNVPNNAR